VQQQIANGIGHGGVTDVGMPVLMGYLAGKDGGSCLVAVLGHLQ